jgi:hypothetical protein
MAIRANELELKHVISITKGANRADELAGGDGEGNNAAGEAESQGP